MMFESELTPHLQNAAGTMTVTVWDVVVTPDDVYSQSNATFRVVLLFLMNQFRIPGRSLVPYEPRV